MNQKQLRDDTEPRSVDQQQACSATELRKLREAPHPSVIKVGGHYIDIQLGQSVRVLGMRVGIPAHYVEVTDDDVSWLCKMTDLRESPNDSSAGTSPLI